MKYIAGIRKETGVCEYVTILETIEQDTEFIIYREVVDQSYTYRKYDIKNEKWLDEYVEPPIQNLPDIPKEATIKSVQEELEELKKQAKTDNLLLLRTILEAVEEITTPKGGE